MKRILIFASGSGSNAENIIDYFKNHASQIVNFEIFTNNPNAGVIERAHRLNIPLTVFTKEDFETDSFLLKTANTDLIVLAGFLWLIPTYFIRAYSNKIVNIHPSLLPSYGGKGMYGDRVHKAVLDNNEKYSGISIHYVNEKYDEGEILLQAKCEIDKNDTSSTLANKIHMLEYIYYPVLINQLIGKK